MIERPEIIENEHLEFLDVLRESGVTNMLGAASYIEQEYPELSKKESKKILVYWMKTFGKEKR